MILGVGTDLVNIERIRKVLDRFGDRFEERVFSKIEIQKSRGRYDPSSSYAKRWAAKEACSKALGTGLGRGVSWKEMHIVNLSSGKPELVVEGKAKDFLTAMTPRGYTSKIHVTLTDDFPWAKATVIIEGIS